jgi:serine/threonine protein kinase
MEYVDGPNLDQLVRKQGPLSVGLACDYIRQVAVGLQCAHLMGMVHRDIKPANILVQRKGLSEGQPGLVKISDFGLARLHSPSSPRVGGTAGSQSRLGTILTRDNAVMGTPDFLSPEQARNLHKVDIRSDLYSVGCTFYYLLTGQVPYPGGNALDKLIRHTTESPAPVTNFRSDVPRPVLDILERLLSKRPEDRFQTPVELAAALEPYAVSGVLPWAPPPTAMPLSDLPEVPLEDVLTGSDPELLSAASDEWAALHNTVGSDAQPTPLTGQMGVRPLPGTGALNLPKAWVKRALIWATCIVSGLILAGFLLTRFLR